MCGIVGVVGPPGSARKEELERAVQSLKHRGPDNQRTWVSSAAQVGLGHARLSIIDLSGGDQPIGNEDDTIRTVVNGEFYDFERIRCELEGKGHVFRTRSDSEILVHLYEEYGAHCLQHLRGEFAFLLWDAPHRRLFVGRDRFGIKPLYYASHRGVMYFASEAKALFAAGVPAEWDLESLLDGTVTDPNRSMFAGVRQVPVGGYLLHDSGHVEPHTYWDLDFPIEEDLKHKDPREHIEELNRVLHESIRLRLRADVPVACYLSGGLDSCAVLGIASQHSSKPLQAYTLAFDHADYDERVTAEAQAKLSGAEFTPIEIRSEHLADCFEDAIWHAERPFVNAHCVAKFLLSRAVRGDGTRVVLTGEGSDEVFAGYPHFRKDLVTYQARAMGAEEARELLAKLDSANRVSQGILLAESGDPSLSHLQRRLDYVPSFLEPFAAGRAALVRLLTPEFREAAETRNPFQGFLDHFDLAGRLSGRHPVNQSLYLWGRSMLPNYIVSNLGDRMEMAHSIEGRVPFLDHKVAECAARMPVCMKIKGMTEKYVLREAAKPVLTEEVYRRQKHPFLSPPSTLQMGGRLYALVQDKLRGSSLRGIGIYDQKKVTALFDALPAMPEADRTRLDGALMTLLSQCLLHERFGL